MSSKMPRDDNPRELIGVVTLSDGRKIEVRMPTIGDVLEGAAQGIPHMQVMVTSATGMTWNSFRILPVPDGTAVLMKLSTAIEAMNAYINNTGKLN